MRVVLAIVLLSGCALYVAPEPESAPAPPDDVDAGGSCDGELYQACAEACEFGCWWPVECFAGRSPVYDPTPVPCWEWTDSCAPVEVVECAMGCDVDGSYWEVTAGTIDQRRVCNEYPTAQPGDPCDEEYDCRPTRLELQADGALRQTYLACGGSACVVINDRPPLDWYLEACEVAVPFAPGSTGVWDYCMYVDVPGDCLYTGASPECDGDWECPQGSSCDAGLTILDPQGWERGGRCRPGLPGTPLPIAELTPTICAGG